MPCVISSLETGVVVFGWSDGSLLPPSSLAAASSSASLFFLLRRLMTNPIINAKGSVIKTSAIVTIL